jgi:hypothetical protein
VARRANTSTLAADWIRQRQQERSDAVPATRDERARRHSWEITKVTGRFGFGARSYRGPRFSDGGQVWAGMSTMLRRGQGLEVPGCERDNMASGQDRSISRDPRYHTEQRRAGLRGRGHGADLGNHPGVTAPSGSVTGTFCPRRADEREDRDRVHIFVAEEAADGLRPTAYLMPGSAEPSRSRHRRQLSPVGAAAPRCTYAPGSWPWPGHVVLDRVDESARRYHLRAPGPTHPSSQHHRP